MWNEWANRKKWWEQFGSRQEIIAMYLSKPCEIPSIASGLPNTFENNYRLIAVSNGIGCGEQRRHSLILCTNLMDFYIRVEWIELKCRRHSPIGMPSEKKKDRNFLKTTKISANQNVGHFLFFSSSSCAQVLIQILIFVLAVMMTFLFH